MPRITRRTTAIQTAGGKENQSSSERENTTPSNKKARHRLSTTELARLEDLFKQDTHPSRQQKKDLAAQLGMDYKTITIWFQNRRQTAKRGQHPAERSDSNWRRTRADSCLRTVSSPSLNATLEASEGVSSGGSAEAKSDSITSKAIVKIKPLLDSLNALTSRSGHSESMEAEDEAPSVEDADLDTLSENATASSEPNRHSQSIKQQPKGNVKTIKWRRVRTLEWACERQTKRRKLSREGYVRLKSEEVQDSDSNGAHMDSALSLLSLATSTGPPEDVMRGVSLLLSLKHSWRRK